MHRSTLTSMPKLDTHKQQTDFDWLGDWFETNSHHQCIGFVEFVHGCLWVAEF